MSVLIMGMDMPRACYNCVMLCDDGDYPICRITGEQRGYNFNTRKKRMDKCPLVEIPPHGDLIDRDAIKYNEKPFACDDWVDRYTINDLPVIIPANKEVYKHV